MKLQHQKSRFAVLHFVITSLSGYKLFFEDPL